MCYKPKTIATRSFPLTFYHPDDKNQLAAQCPDVCTGATPGQGRCKISLDHRRHRKTGPSHPLWVMRCRTHGIAFTLYPPGFTPWGRKPWVHLSPDGTPLAGEAGREAFRNTYFDAAIDAADGVSWPREKDPDDVSPLANYDTQCCQLRRAAQLLGFEQQPLEAFAQTLWLPGQVIHQALSALPTPPDRTGLGRFVVGVLEHLRADLPSLFERLAACGAAAGLWPPVHVWRPRIRQLLPRRFHHTESAMSGVGY